MRSVSSFMLVAALASAAACAPAPAPRPPDHRPASPRYRTLDPRLHHYAVTYVGPYEEHYTATTDDNQGIRCAFTYSSRWGRRLQRCETGSWSPAGGSVPSGREGLAREMSEEARQVTARDVPPHVTYDGTFRLVRLEEEIPCDGAHGRGASFVHLRYDEDLRQVQEHHEVGSTRCRAPAPFSWGGPEPRWLPLTSATPLLDGSDGHPLPPALTTALQQVLHGR